MSILRLRVFILRTPSFFSFHKGIIVNIHLKDYDYKKYGVVPCIEFGKRILPRMMELAKYLGENSVPWINIYHNGKNICGYDDFYLGKA
jgi:hypothetical protein